VGLSEKDIELVPLQHPDGQAALERGDVDAWSGLDPLMATSEERGSNLRTHTLHDPVDYKLRELGEFALNGKLATAGFYS
jgi:ABC-type nitrate/sulfonate/bicarbonate transport system substrate-binding protein